MLESAEKLPARKNPNKRKISFDQLAAYGVDEFCAAHGISRAKFYDLLKIGKGPRVMKVGTRTLISREAAADWRREMEAA